MLSSGSKDKSILQRDLREKADYFASLYSHKQEVCGLKWSSDAQQLASGGNDNKLFVWSLHNNREPQGKFSSHVAAVKVISPLKIPSYLNFLLFVGYSLVSFATRTPGKWRRHARQMHSLLEHFVNARNIEN